jgi:hypothetical protein
LSEQWETEKQSGGKFYPDVAENEIDEVEPLIESMIQVTNANPVLNPPAD